MKDKITVVVPCYNVEKYVAKCLDSIINQTYDNLEIIAVEDCSTDNTYEILKEYLKKDKRIKLVKNKVNSGLSFSRNMGISEATGEYISFIDSDDYIDLNYYENLHNALIDNDADIAICDIKAVLEEENIINIKECYSNNEFNLLNVINTGFAASACNKLFKKHLLLKYLFEVGKINEDIAVIIPALVNAKKLAYAKDTYYYYLQRGGSIQNSHFSDKRFDVFYGVEETLKRIAKCKNYEQIKEALVFNQFIPLLIYVIIKEKNVFKRRHAMKKYHKLIKKYDVMHNSYLNEFLLSCGKKHQLYYKYIISFVCKGLYFLANMLIGTYNFIYKVAKKSVIEKNIDLDKLISLAIKQSNMEDNDIKISVVVPNYNYERFLYQRLYSILAQKVKIHEIIILDDKSSDNSIELIDEIVSNIKNYVNIKTIYNKKNSGSAFKQWQKGFEKATGDYIWITEADDYCSNNFLKEVIKPIEKDKDIVISYADTAFIDKDGIIIMKTIKNEIDLMHTGHFNKSFVNDGMDEINNYTFLNCTIANVSSALFKKDDYRTYFKQAGEFKQAGDYIFYFNVMMHGKVAYNAKPLNYYRVHGSNVTSVTKKQAHFDEVVRVHEYIDSQIHFNDHQKEEIIKRYKYLKKVWGIKIKK